MIKISERLLAWYEVNKRSLPWRETSDPYYIWISEIILQQTRVNQGISYYHNFIREYPTIFSLAQTNIDQLLKIWQGLGYYSRARNMHLTAKTLVDDYNGIFPDNYEGLLKLKGIGQYTASAMASICFNQPVAVVDGNVFRVLSRIFGITESTQAATGKKIFLDLANSIIVKDKPGLFNQAIMEFGALQCTPKNPECISCPFKTECFARKNNLIHELPIKKQKVKQKNRFFNYLYIIYKEYTFIEKRNQNDIWKLLYQLPLIETSEEMSINQLMNNTAWTTIFENLDISIEPQPFKKTHILSHQKLQTYFYKIDITKTNSFLDKEYIQVPMADLNNYSVPRLIETYFDEINN